MRQDSRSREADGRRASRFSRQLAIVLIAGLALLCGALASAWWMARQQDEMIRSTSRRMVSGALESLVERAQASILDYAIWDDAYQHMVADDVPWMQRNIEASVDIGTYNVAIVMRPHGEPIAFEVGGRDTDVAGVIDPNVLAAINGLLADVPIDSHQARTAFARSKGEVWLFAAARVVPQSGLPPAGATDADLPRLIFGHRLTADVVGSLGENFAIYSLAVADTLPAAGDSLPLPGPDGPPVAWLAWNPPTPGRSVLEATLGPLAALLGALALIAVLASRELVRSAKRLEAALAGARAADSLKSEFLSNVSHELRTPLSGIIGLTQLLQMRDPDPESREMLDLLLASANAQLHLVNGLLDISRIESGAIDLDRTPFDPAAVVEETARLAAPDAAAKALALQVKVAPDARRPVLGDPYAFRQIVTNLVGNAVKFTAEGTVAVSLDPTADGRDLRLVVADTGLGIAPGDHHRIFERFVQVDGSSTRKTGGAGLGLAITAALVALMGGRIEVESALGAGSRFTVTLPLAPAARPGGG